MGDRRGIRKGGPYAKKWVNATGSENSDDDANTGDHGPSKKSKPNSDAPLPETGKANPFTSNSTSLTPDRHIEPKAIVFTPSSTSSKTSNQFTEQISSKTPAQHSSASSNWSTLSNGLYNRREDKNFWDIAIQELVKRPKTGKLYETIKADNDLFRERMKELSNIPNPTIDESLEMADGALVLKLMRQSNDEIETAEQNANRGATLLHQGEMLMKKGQELIKESQRLIRSKL